MYQFVDAIVNVLIIPDHHRRICLSKQNPHDT